MTATTRPAKRADRRRPATPDEWAERIKSRLSLGITGAVEAGQAMAEWKEYLPHGEFEGMISHHVGINPSTARRLIAIGANEYIANRSHGNDLPASWTTLYALSQLSPEQLAEAVAGREVHPAMDRETACALVRRYVDGTGGSPKRAVHKPDLGGDVHHPAKYSDAVLDVLGDLLHAELLVGHRQVLDPFAGTGRIHELAGLDTVGVELEPEWAALAAGTIVGNALALPFADEYFDAIATSPCYANRMADSHNAVDPESRYSYTHDLGRPLHPDNAGALQWGKKYRAFHMRAWAEVDRVLRPGGAFALNIKDHTRDGQRVAVSSWHGLTLIEQFGFELVDVVAPATPGLRNGANANARWGELVWLLRKP